MKLVRSIVLCLFIATAMASCGDDDGDGIDGNLFGTWTKVSTVLRDCSNPNDNGSTPETCTDQACETLTMTDDLRYELSVLVRGQAQVERGIIQVSESQIRFLPENTTATRTFGYSVSANSMTLSNETVICIEDIVYDK